MSTDKKTKVGAFLSWDRTAGSSSQDIHCFCKVLRVRPDRIRVLTLDDFQEVDVPTDSQAYEELSGTTEQEVKQFLNDKGKVLDEQHQEACTRVRKTKEYLTEHRRNRSIYSI